MAERDPAKPMTDREGEVRELQDEDFVRAQHLDDLPSALQAKLRRGRGPQKAPTKELISLRVSRDVLSHFRETGEGWQGRMDDALRDWIQRRDTRWEAE
jgi:uncharacterized protein (DUF4415 family)